MLNPTLNLCFIFLQLIGPQFIWAMQPALQDQWTTELEEAWSDLFKMIAHVMKNAMQF
jgi:hemoglobin-like flavoprotein